MDDQEGRFGMRSEIRAGRSKLATVRGAVGPAVLATARRAAGPALFATARRAAGPALFATARRAVGSAVLAAVALSGPVATGAGAVAAKPARWQWPVSPARVMGAYAAPPSPYAAGHRGIDIAAAPGATVVAPSHATVHFVGVVVDRPVLTLDHGGGVLSSYEPVIAQGAAAAGAGPGLRVGDPVSRGSVVGVVGTGAHCSAVCLHVGVRIDGAYVSPLLFFDRVPRSVLLPLHRDGAPSAHARGWAMR